jgi:hypothetical protein
LPNFCMYVAIIPCVIKVLPTKSSAIW